MADGLFRRIVYGKRATVCAVSEGLRRDWYFYVVASGFRDFADDPCDLLVFLVGWSWLAQITDLNEHCQSDRYGSITSTYSNEGHQCAPDLSKQSAVV